jgi:transcriptional regulator with XRE-family HTH domain
MDIKIYMGSKIKEYRKVMNLTTHELGELSGTSQSTISEIERGNRSIQVESLAKICKALGVTLGDVLPIDNEDQNEKSDSQQSQLLNLIDSLSHEEIHLLIQILLKINKLSDQDRAALKSLLYSLMNK